MARTLLADSDTIVGTGDLVVRSPVPRLFWAAAVMAAAVFAAGRSFDPKLLSLAALWLMLLGGLPHGAYDIATARRALALSNRRALLLFSLYIGVALLMAMLWTVSPGLALSIFLASAAIHFGEDWDMLDTGLFRATAGASVICIPAIFQPAEVGQLFLLMGGQQAETVTKIAIATAPVAILVMLTALARAFVQGDRQWAVAQATSFVGLAVLPLILGFTLFFVFLHSPLHMREVRHSLPGWTPRSLAAYGLAICSLGLLGGFFFFEQLVSDIPEVAMANGFKVLSSLAAPHLMLHFFIKKHHPQTA